MPKNVMKATENEIWLAARFETLHCVNKTVGTILDLLTLVPNRFF
jgi:hypothetical protein